MSGYQFSLPTLQNWSCHNCSGCCRQHLIEITEEERQRIVGQKWSSQDGLPSDRPPLVWFAGPPWRKRYRLAHQDDGACVFLNEKGLCRIHAKFGEEAKPLPCRIYPYAFHPAGKKLAVGLRFSCPSVVANRGKPVSQQGADLTQIARAVVPAGYEKTPPPRITSSEKVDWPDVFRLLRALDASFAEAEIPVTIKLLRTLFWINLVDRSTFDKLQGSRLDDFLQLITKAAKSEITEDLSSLGEPGRIGRMQFRLLVAQYSRKDTIAERDAGWQFRWKLFRAGMRFARGTGNIPPLQDAFREVPFDALEKPFGGLPADAEEIFSRYFRVKIQGLHFCGPAYYHVSLVEGFRSLALIYPSILWLARWLAAGDNRNKLEIDDITTAMTIADHHHGYSPAFGQRNFRRRVRILAQFGEIEKLCAWYSR